jgi:hypothetical protein
VQSRGALPFFTRFTRTERDRKSRVQRSIPGFDKGQAWYRCGQALDLCQELFVADGSRSDEEDAVLQNLKELLE